ncbi:ATP-dependent DNA helicase PIF7 [Collichthys lucidus]|uniref:ATP-dependent DNA helicase n=1 Tax=Collichthys lucidus TaxID=240159 RepID=A0A4U5TX51_COLLU|nr:ATP-dependent DNA helicase PIF7 [Collichthys lucidus]
MQCCYPDVLDAAWEVVPSLSGCQEEGEEAEELDDLSGRQPRGRCTFGWWYRSAAQGVEVGGVAADQQAAQVGDSSSPEAVIVLAPSNNLTASRGLENSSADFAALLKTARSRWSNVVVLDFPPRLSVEEDQQKLLRMAYHSACADQGVPYHHICENFPLHQRDLWARDGTHLSDSAGMPILAYLLWQAADRQLAEPEPEPHVAPIPTCPYRPRFATQVVVKGIKPQPRPAANPDGWITVVNGQKRSLPEAELAALDKQVSQKMVCYDEFIHDLTEVDMVELRECFIPLTPVRFSPATLRAIEKTSPSFLPTPEEGTAVPVCIQKQKVAVKRRTVVAKRRLPKEQVDTVVSAVEVSRVAKPPTAVPVVDKVDTTMSDVEVFSVVTPTSAVSTPAVDEDEATLHAVDLTSEPVAVTVHVGDQLQPPHPATPGSIELQPAQPATSIELQAAHPATPGSIELQPAQPAISRELQAAHPATPGSIKLRQGPGGNKVGDKSEVSLNDVQCLTVRIEKSVRGPFHQGSRLLKNPGVQCMVVSLVSLAKHNVRSVFQWEMKHLDSVLRLDGDGQTFAFKSGSWVIGKVGLDQGELIDSVLVSMTGGLKSMLAEYGTCFLTIAGSTCAVICEHGRYAVVDSHARNACGMVDANGKSVVVHLPTLEDVCHYARQLSVSLGAEHKLFEICAVSVTIPVADDPSSQCLSEHAVCAETGAVSVTIPVADDPSSECLSEHAVCAEMTVTDCDSESASIIESSTKRKRPNVNFALKTRKSSDVTAVISDVEFTCDVSSKGLQFDPVDKKVAQALCKQLNVECEKQDRQMRSSVGMLGTPCMSDSIVADGNCFFRAVSEAASGTQKYHIKLRRAVVKHVEKNAVRYTSFLRSQYSSVDQYLNASRMRYAGSWATEFEIQATADFLGVSVYTYYNDRWLKYSCTNKAMSKQGIYLQHVNGCHYEVVVCVNQPQLQNCYGLCKGNHEPYSSKRQRAVRSVRQSPEAKRSRTSDCRVDGVCIDNDILQYEVIDVDATKTTCKYHPLCNEMSQQLCQQLNIDLVKPCVNDASVHGSAGGLCKTEQIVDDGNGFFRAVCNVISGSQKAHRKVRLSVVKHMNAHSDIYMKLIGKEYLTVSEYVKEVKMNYVGSCISEIQIQATANALGVEIFIFSGGMWLSYFPMTTKQTDEGIYLSKCANNHFEAVTCVQDSDRNMCFQLCKDNQSLDTQYMTKRTCKQVTSTVSLKSSGNYCFSKYLKTKLCAQKKDMFKRLYQQNMLFQQKKREMNLIQYKKIKDIIKESLKLTYNKSNVCREIKKNRSTTKYKNDALYREKMIDQYKTKYKNDALYREKMIDQYKTKYKNDALYREKMIDQYKTKYKKRYHEDALFRENVKIAYKLQYHKDLPYQKKAKERSKIKYRVNLKHRQSIKARSAKTYRGSTEFRKRVSGRVTSKRQQLKVQSEDFDFVMDRFLDKVKNGPDFVCCVCHRLLFRHQVLQCRRDYYREKAGVCVIAEQCITEHYLHLCSRRCESPCRWVDTPRSELWICYTCHYKINKGQVPAESVKNNLALDPIPPELACLNKLEQHLIALHIPFMKMLALPKGGQNGVHGPVTCVPSNIVETTNLLPRTSMEGSLLPVKLKRKLTYKGYYEYEYVDTTHIKQALQYLKENNVHYKEVHFNAEWSNEFSKPDADVQNGTERDIDSVEQSAVQDDELLHDRQQHCMFQDTCLMPVDIGQEALDQYFDDVLNLAPAEGNCPVRFLTDHSNEALCFPLLFPKGSPTYHDDRQHRLTLSRYFNNRILHADGRFAHNVEYIFFAQYMSELEQVVSNVSIALRKGQGSGKGHRVSGEAFHTEELLRKLLKFDDGFRFLKPIRGTPAFWQGAQRDLLACVRQLGIPTWFCSFSAADMRWKNLLSSILKQAGRTDTAEQLEWADRCELLRRNSVTAARMFDFRWHCFLRDVLMSPANPIGKIKDYFYRVEFQQRGSPHVHCLFWIEDAPVIDTNTDAEVIEFIDRYVTCELPSNDEELLDTVTSVQQHSKRHAKTCKKGKTVCRFNFPRPPSARTFISRSLTHEDSCASKLTEGQSACNCKGKTPLMKKEAAADIMFAIKEALRNDSLTFETAEELFQHVGVSQGSFEAAYDRCASKTQVVLKRQANAVWINQYSKPLLKCWNANIDVQFVVDAYACVVYIISYISKAEKEMGLLLQCAQREAAKEGNRDAKDSLKHLGSVYLHNRDVCAQEAVYRLTNMRLKECSRKVVFVPVGEKTVRMSLPLKVLQRKALSHDLSADDMWMTNIVDRYRSRPVAVDFRDMCLASFASQYRVLSKNETPANRIKLGNNCGYVVKRTRTQPAVVRYVRFSETKNPELFFQSILQLFMPYYTDGQLRPVGFETYQDFYLNGQVRCADNLMRSVKSVVDRNRSTFEVESEELDNVEELIHNDGIAEDAWCELCPEQELERLECREILREERQANGEPVEHIPDLAVLREQVGHLEKRNTVMCRSDGLALLRSLNETQMGIFYQVREWCVQQAQGKQPDPFHIFVTGGAGTGKSHLIKAIQYEAMRILAPVCHQPDDICVLLTAPTGIAAYNLHATTIHSTFSIGKAARLPYTPLGEDKVNSLRAKYRSLQIVIIDEISMVDHNMLVYIHGRLRQIKQVGDSSSLFGNISIIAVGDFFQLPPVRGKPLHVANDGVDLWSGVFNSAVLHTVVRQKDKQFAKLLNRVRTHSKGTAMLSCDVQLLKSRETGEDSSALHIFPTNRQVSEHNLECIRKTCPDYVCVSAQDYVNSKKTGKVVLLKGHHSIASNTCLEETLLLGKGARVMLCKNVDVADGLVNGVCGSVTDIVYGDNDKKFPRKVYMKSCVVLQTYFSDHDAIMCTFTCGTENNVVNI